MKHYNETKEILNINVKLVDVFNYVCKVTDICPIEKHIDTDRYDVYGYFIYDKKDHEYLYQDDKFTQFSNGIQTLRDSGVSKTSNETDESLRIILECFELTKKAPNTIYL